MREKDSNDFSAVKSIDDSTAKFNYYFLILGETITNKAPSVVIEGQDQGIVNAKSGEPVQLVCKVEAYPKPDIVWKNKATGVILSNQVFNSDNNFIVAKITKKFNTQGTCVM